MSDIIKVVSVVSDRTDVLPATRKQRDHRSAHPDPNVTTSSNASEIRFAEHEYRDDLKATDSDFAPMKPENAFRRIATAARSWLRRATEEDPNRLEGFLGDGWADGVPITDWDAMGYRDFSHWRMSISFLLIRNRTLLTIHSHQLRKDCAV